VASTEAIRRRVTPRPWHTSTLDLDFDLDTISSTTDLVGSSSMRLGFDSISNKTNLVSSSSVRVGQARLSDHGCRLACGEGSFHVCDIWQAQNLLARPCTQHLGFHRFPLW
jgi:hypothetical protein